MFETTMSRDMITETTQSSMVPGAHIEVAFQKLGRDVSKYLKGSGALPYDSGNERGYYHIDQMPVLPESLPEMLEALYRIQEDGTERSKDLASALVENLTTRNDITNEELSWVYKIAEDGGQFELTKIIEATPGMSKVLSRYKYKGNCGECDFKVPKYAGRYPKYCPECGSELALKEKSQGGFPRTHYYLPPKSTKEVVKDSFELEEAHPRHRALEVLDALKILDKRVKLMQGAALTEAVVAQTYPLPEEATNLQKALLGEAEESPHEIFDALVDYLLESSDPCYDKLVGVMMGESPLDEGMAVRLRQEVEKRKPLVKSIRSLVEMADEDRRYFTLNKALSSCFTRVMIEGETRGGGNFKFLGKHIFEMMQRALEGDLDGPARFLNTYFLEG
jgi:hypothetical protein